MILVNNAHEEVNEMSKTIARIRIRNFCLFVEMMIDGSQTVHPHTPNTLGFFCWVLRA